MVDLFVCREIGERASFREDRSGHGGMLNSLSLSLCAHVCLFLCLCVCACVCVRASSSESLFNNYGFRLDIL